MRPSSPDPVEVGAILKAYRRRQNLSQEHLASRAGLDRTYIGLVERGKRRPTVDAVSRMLTVLGIPWAEFGAALDDLLAARSSTRSA
jgi:transcriptional regulator with XRE-family HTH domain